ncbi:hypothetical protein HDU93_006005 [Gonapodya sp. JEL0774]|nr:hypothetical protein HDU93_006005 [Gonapodya sp. JEL0774]
MSTTREIELINAVEQGNLDRVKQLLDDGTNPNTRKRVTLTVDITDRRLVQKGGLFSRDKYADVQESKTETLDCESALALAIIHHREDIVGALLEKGADPNGVCEWKISNGYKPWEMDDWDQRRWQMKISFPCALMLAMAHGGSFIRWDGNPAFTAAHDHTSLHISPPGGHVQIQNPYGWDDFVIATLQPSLLIVKVLVLHGANVSDAERSAARKMADSKFIQILEPHAEEQPNKVRGQSPESAPSDLIRQNPSPVRKQLTAILDYTPKNSDEVVVSEGDLVFVTEKYEDGWCSGFNIITNKSGFLPLSCLQTAMDNEATGLHAMQHAPPAAELSPENQAKPSWHIDYEGIEVGEKLGEGSFGVVHKCLWAGATVAVKFLILDTSRNGQLRKNYKIAFDREVSAWHKAGSHPNIVPLLGASWESPRPLMLSKFMKHRDVVTYFEENPSHATPERKIRILYDIAAGMLYLHDVRNIVHADLKPQNTLVDDDGTTQVSDFGTAKIVDLPTNEATGRRIGTSVYMPPERLLGGGATKEGDVYAFGVTIFRIWTGRAPYQEFNELPADFIVDRRRKLRPLISEFDEMPEDLEQLAQECWAHEPAMRPRFRDIVKRLKVMRDVS